MSTKRLARLVELSEQLSRQHLRELIEARQERQRLSSQHAELVVYANSYQNDPAAHRQMLPTMLGQRRQFIQGVLAEAEKLRVRIQDLDRLLDERQRRHRRCAAETLALESVHGQADLQDRRTQDRHERQELDEAGSRGSEFRLRSGQGD